MCVCVCIKLNLFENNSSAVTREEEYKLIIAQRIARVWNILQSVKLEQSTLTHTQTHRHTDTQTHTHTHAHIHNS